MVLRRFSQLFLLSAVAFLIGSAQPSGVVRLLSHYIPPSGGSYVAGCWGWTDTTTGREYALLGSFCGTSIVEITNPATPVERAFVPGVCSSWREIQVYQHYAYVVSEGGGGTQIIDLSFLPDSAHLVKSFNYANVGGNIVRSHTITIKDGTMYLNGCANWSVGGILLFSLADPVNPVFLSAYERQYVHDCFVRNDTIFAAAIYGVGVDIVNASNKLNPVHLYTIAYTGAGTHNTATTTDGKYVLSTDEIGSAGYTLKIWDRQSPPTFPRVAEYIGSPTAIVHNVFVKGNLAIMSYYTKGIKVLDITDPTAPVEIGGYDTYPADDHQGYTGAWSTYPYFPSGRIIIGDMETGLYVVDMDTAAPNNVSGFSAYSDYQTPTSVALSWTDPTTTVGGSPLGAFKIHLFRDGVFLAEVNSGVQTYTDNALNQHQLYAYLARVVAASDSSGGTASSAYAGGSAFPRPPTAFIAAPAIGGVQLTWTNPSRQLDNTPLNDLAAIRVYRDGIFLKDVPQTSADTGQARAAFDSISGYHAYFLQAVDNELPVHVSSATPTVNTFGNLYVNYVEGFEGSISQLLRTGAWDTTSALAHRGVRSFTDSRIGTYAPGFTSSFQTPPVILGSTPVLQFSHIAIIAFGDIGYVEISKNAGASFTVLKPYNMTMRPEWQDSVANPADWYTDAFQLGAYAGDTVIVRFRLVTNSSVNTDGWYIDDILLGDQTIPVSAVQQFVPGWNMISLPVAVADGRRTTLYPDAISTAYLYNGSSYVPTDTLVPGSGYWLKFAAPSAASPTGPSVLRDTLPVHPRWNLIGALSGRIPASAVKSIPTGIITSNFYSYNGGYAIASSLESGNAYWVKTNLAGSLVLSAFQNGAAPVELPKEMPDAFNTLTFRDAAGHRQTLYFLASLDGAIDAARYDAPPIPPAEAFDVRFRSDRLLEGRSAAGRDLFPIALQSVHYPLTVQWEVKERGIAPLLLFGEGEPVLLSGSGTRTLSQEGSGLALKIPHAAAEMPGTFALRPAYPNPFNPATELRYDIAERGVVRITIYDLLGREVTTLASGEREPGTFSATWNAGGAPSGIYYARMTVASNSGAVLFRETQKLILVR